MREKVIICFFGTCSRAIKYTHENHIEKIINIVKDVYDVDIYVFNNNVEKKLIDGKSQNNDNVKLIKSNYFEEETQTYIDNKISEKVIKHNIIYKMRFDYSKECIQNAIRQMYSEEKVGIFLEKHKNDYKCAIVCNPDNYLINKINMEHIKNSINNNSNVYTTTVNDADGYTNGFYIGSLQPLIKILKRFSILEFLLPTDKNYEFLLKKSFEIYKINRLVTDTEYFKIRSNTFIARQGKMKHYKYNSLVKDIKRKVNQNIIKKFDL